MALKTSELNARLFAKADKRRATTVQEAQQAATDKAPFIELAIAGETTVSFELVRVPAADVASRTQVFEENAREQSFLNEMALSDILVTLKKSGQQYPAVGRWLDDGRIDVLDGSRRRMACIVAEQDFLVYVGKGISTRHAKYLSDVANAHKPLSLYERGKEMQAMLDRGEAIDQKDLAKVCNCSESLVSGALKAAALPLELLQAYPSVAELGRPTIVKLHKLFYTLEDNQQSALLKKLGEGNEPFWKAMPSQGVSRITRDVTLDIESWCAMQKEPETKASDVEELVAGNASYKRKGQSLSINIKKLSEEDASAILEYIQKTLG